MINNPGYLINCKVSYKLQSTHIILYIILNLCNFLVGFYPMVKLYCCVIFLSLEPPKPQHFQYILEILRNIFFSFTFFRNFRTFRGVFATRRQRAKLNGFRWCSATVRSLFEMLMMKLLIVIVHGFVYT